MLGEHRIEIGEPCLALNAMSVTLRKFLPRHELEQITEVEPAPHQIQIESNYFRFHLPEAGGVPQKRWLTPLRITDLPIWQTGNFWVGAEGGL